MKNDIVEAFKHRDVIRTCRQYGGEYWQDLRQDTAVSICQMDKDSLSKVNNMVAFMIRCVVNKAKDMKKKRMVITINNLVDYPDIPPPESNLMTKVYLDCISQKRFYEARMFVFTNIVGNHRSFQKLSKIPYRECRDAYMSYVKYLRNYFNEQV